LRINGEVTHFIDWANPRQEGVTSDRRQIYFLESIGESVEARVERSRLLDRAANERIVLLLEYIRANNLYAEPYQNLRQVVADNADTPVQSVVLAINALPPGMWRRRGVPLNERYWGDVHEAPRENSVHAVFDGAVPPNSYDVMVRMRRGPDDVFVPEHDRDRILFVRPLIPCAIPCYTFTVNRLGLDP